MHADINFKNEYLHWLHENTELVRLNSGTSRLTTPFLDFDNDHIEIYIKHSEEKIFLSDGGDTISNLEFSNLNIQESARRNRILNELAASYNVNVSTDNEMFVQCSFDDFPQHVNLLIQCMIKVSDMLMLSDNNIRTIFSDTVRSYFDLNDVIYTPNVNIIGKSKFYTRYEFVLPKFKSKPERFITTINSLSENVVKATLFSWDDIRKERDANSVLFAVINDSEYQIKAQAVNAFQEYDIKCFKWSERENYLSDFKTA